MVKISTFIGMVGASFVFWHSMDKIHVWIALHQDQKQERMEQEAEVRRMRAEILRQQAEQKDPLA